jgi:hypothetical protein
MKAMDPGKEFPAAANRKQGLPQSFKSRATIQDFVQALPAPEAKALLEFSQGLGVADPVTLSRACIARLEDNRQDTQVRKLMARAGADGSFGNLGDVLESLMTQVEDNAAPAALESPELPPPENIAAAAKPLPQAAMSSQTPVSVWHDRTDFWVGPFSPAAAQAWAKAAAPEAQIKRHKDGKAYVGPFATSADAEARISSSPIESTKKENTMSAQTTPKSTLGGKSVPVKAGAAPAVDPKVPVKSNDETNKTNKTNKTNLPGEPGIPELPDDVGLDTGTEGEPEGTPEERAEFDKMVLLELEEQVLGEDTDGDGDFPDEEYPADFEELKQARKILAAAGEVVPSEDTPPEGEHTEPDLDDEGLDSFDDSEIQVDVDANTITLDTCGSDGEPCREEYSLEDGYLTLTGDDTGVDDPDEAPAEPVDLFTETNGDVQEAVDFILDLQAGADTVIDMTDEYAEEPAEEPGAEDDTLNK